MRYFLAKTDPHTYSITDLEKDKITTWDGVTNPQAIKVIQGMQVGDRVFIYHSQGEASIRGLAQVTKRPRPDPEHNKSWVVDIKFVRKFKEPYITLRDVKATNKFKDFTLVYHSRLSTMECPTTFITWLTTKGLFL
jgi:predicted RNA-binding protein with PUA-like domain